MFIPPPSNLPFSSMLTMYQKDPRNLNNGDSVPTRLVLFGWDIGCCKVSLFFKLVCVGKFYKIHHAVTVRLEAQIHSMRNRRHVRALGIRKWDDFRNRASPKDYVSCSSVIFRHMVKLIHFHPLHLVDSVNISVKT